jgi:hypothetical protein
VVESENVFKALRAVRAQISLLPRHEVKAGPGLCSTVRLSEVVAVLDDRIEKERGVAAAPAAESPTLADAVNEMTGMVGGAERLKGFVKLTPDDRKRFAGIVAVELLVELQPHLDGLIDYASTISEAPLNGTVERVHSLLRSLGRSAV